MGVDFELRVIFAFGFFFVMKRHQSIYTRIALAAIQSHEQDRKSIHPASLYVSQHNYVSRYSKKRIFRVAMDYRLKGGNHRKFIHISVQYKFSITTSVCERVRRRFFRSYETLIIHIFTSRYCTFFSQKILAVFTEEHPDYAVFPEKSNGNYATLSGRSPGSFAFLRSRKKVVSSPEIPDPMNSALNTTF